jgi:hypothetical protein
MIVVIWLSRSKKDHHSGLQVGADSRIWGWLGARLILSEIFFDSHRSNSSFLYNRVNLEQYQIRISLELTNQIFLYSGRDGAEF